MSNALKYSKLKVWDPFLNNEIIPHFKQLESYQRILFTSYFRILFLPYISWQFSYEWKLASSDIFQDYSVTRLKLLLYLSCNFIVTRLQLYVSILQANAYVCCTLSVLKLRYLKCKTNYVNFNKNSFLFVYFIESLRKFLLTFERT